MQAQPIPNVVIVLTVFPQGKAYHSTVDPVCTEDMSPLDLPKVPLRDLLFVKLRFIQREEVRQTTEPADILLTLNLLWWQQQRQD